LFLSEPIPGVRVPYGLFVKSGPFNQRFPVDPPLVNWLYRIVPHKEYLRLEEALGDSTSWVLRYRNDWPIPVPDPTEPGGCPLEVNEDFSGRGYSWVSMAIGYNFSLNGAYPNTGIWFNIVITSRILRFPGDPIWAAFRAWDCYVQNPSDNECFTSSMCPTSILGYKATPWGIVGSHLADHEDPHPRPSVSVFPTDLDKDGTDEQSEGLSCMHFDLLENM